MCVQLQVDEKAERAATLQSELRAKETWVANAEKTIAELKKQLETREVCNARWNVCVPNSRRHQPCVTHRSVKSNVCRMTWRRRSRIADCRREIWRYRSDEERGDLLEHFRSLSQEATELETHNHSLKSETSEVKRTLQATEGQMRQVRDHSQGLEKDLNAVRDLCMKLDTQKEALQEELDHSRRQCNE
ncbi:hypothetical protein B566_EDAN003948, partial [Ephemera danica]